MERNIARATTSHYVGHNDDSDGNTGTVILNFYPECPYAEVCSDYGLKCLTCGRQRKSYWIPEPYVPYYPYPWTWSYSPVVWEAIIGKESIINLF